jgi:hypothetical protein
LRSHQELESHERRRGPASSSSNRLHGRSLLERAGNAAITQALQGNVPLAVQRELGSLDPRLIPRDQLEHALKPSVDSLPQVKPKILAWLEPQRNEIENRALFTGAGFSPERAISMPELVAMVREHLPEALQITPAQVAGVIREWAHVQIPEHKLAGGVVASSEIEAAVQNALGKPGTIHVERKGKWMEVTAGGVEAGTDKATVSANWDGSIGASLSDGEWVKGSFQISPDRTWQAQLAIKASATVPVVNQIANVFGAADRSARAVGRRVDSAGGGVRGVSVDVLREGLGPVKDAIDTLTSVTDKENPVSVGLTASGDFGGSIAVQATVTIRW